MLEIEELSKMFDDVDCEVRETGCLGYCRRGPAALITRETKSTDPSDPFPPRERIVHVDVYGMKESKRLVEDAIGKKLSFENVDEKKFQRIRRVRTRKHAKSIYRWNTALLRMEEDAKEMPSLLEDYKELLELSGFPNGLPTNYKDGFKMPSKIEMYTKWTLVNVREVSNHSALYSFESDDLKRGTPHPRGSGRLPVRGVRTWCSNVVFERGVRAHEEYLEHVTHLNTHHRWNTGTEHMAHDNVG